MRSLPTIVIAMCVAACSEQAAVNPTGATPPAQASPAASSSAVVETLPKERVVIRQPPPPPIPESLIDAVLTHDGLGPIRIGMHIDDVNEIAGHVLRDAYGGDYAPNCQAFSMQTGEAYVSVQTDHQRVVAIQVGGGGNRIQTGENVAIGARGETVRRAYPNAERAHAPYVGEPDYDLYVWTSRDRAGLRFEVRGGVVQTIHAGTDAIRYIEGCL